MKKCRSRRPHPIGMSDRWRRYKSWWPTSSTAKFTYPAHPTVASTVALWPMMPMTTGQLRHQQHPNATPSAVALHGGTIAHQRHCAGSDSLVPTLVRSVCSVDRKRRLTLWHANIIRAHTKLQDCGCVHFSKLLQIFHHIEITSKH